MVTFKILACVVLYDDYNTYTHTYTDTFIDLFDNAGKAKAAHKS